MQIVDGCIAHFGTVEEVISNVKILGITGETTTTHKSAKDELERPVIK